MANKNFALHPLDFLVRNQGCLRAAEETAWDLIVVDEAHKLSAYEYGSRPSPTAIQGKTSMGNSPSAGLATAFFCAA